MVCHNSESSLLVEVKSKQPLDPLLMDLKESVFRKSNDFFSQRGMGYFGTKVGCE